MSGPASRRRERLAALRVAVPVWTLFGLACTASALWGMRTHGHSPLRLGGYQVLVWNGWAIGALVVAALGRRWPLLPFSWRAASIHVVAALGLGLVHHAWWALMLVAIHPYDAMGIQTLGPALTHDVADRMFLEATVYFAILGVTYAVDYHRRLRDRELREAQLEASLAQARLTALELQLQPHFLFNTLHAIGGLVRQSRGPEAIEMIASLSDLLRYSLDHAGKHFVTLASEVAIVRRYLDIQAQRFSDRLAIAIDVPAELTGARVPALVLQPLCENAIRHGAERVNEPLTIAVRARREGDSIVLAVENSTPGRTTMLAEGIGIANTRARLEQLYGPRHTFLLQSEPDRVVATLWLPFEEAA